MNKITRFKCIVILNGKKCVKSASTKLYMYVYKSNTLGFAVLGLS